MVGAIPQKLQRVDSANSLFYKKVRSNILPLFPWIHIQHSTFHQPQAGPPLSPERETFRMLPLISFCILALYKNRTFRFTPVICKDCTALHRGLADSKQSLRPLSFLSRTGNVLYAFLHTAFAFLSFTQRKKCHMLPLFLYSDIPHSTFPHQPAKTGLSIVWKSKIS